MATRRSGGARPLKIFRNACSETGKQPGRLRAARAIASWSLQKGTIVSVDTASLERTIIFDKLDEIHELCCTYNVRRLDLFGSALHDDFEPERSDLDFLVEYNAMPLEDRADSFFGLWFGLEDLFGRSVDLIERQTVKNPYIGQAIHATRVMVYDAT